MAPSEERSTLKYLCLLFTVSRVLLREVLVYRDFFELACPVA